MNKSCPEFGLNSRGIAATTLKGPRPVVIDYVDETTGFLFVRDLETNEQFRIYRQFFSMSSSIPSKHRKHHFESVAPIWARAIRDFPKSFLVDVGSLSVETVTRKLREAREAKQTYGWQHPDINDEEWNERCHLISIEPTKNGVLIGSKHKKQVDRQSEQKNELKIVESRDNEVHVRVDFNDVEKLCKLLHEKAFNPKPVFVVHGLTEDQKTDLENRYDIALDKTTDEEGCYVIL